MKPLLNKLFLFPLLLSLLLFSESCRNDDEPDITEKSCSDNYSVNDVYKLPQTSIDVDSDSKRDFVLEFRIDHLPHEPGEPNYNYSSVGIYPSGDRKIDFILKRLTGNRVPDQHWFNLGDTIRKDSFSQPTQNDDEKLFFHSGSDHHIMERTICGGKYEKSWGWANYEKQHEGDVLYMGLYHKKTNELGWLKLGVDIEKGSVEYLDHDYHYDSLVIIGRK